MWVISIICLMVMEVAVQVTRTRTIHQLIVIHYNHPHNYDDDQSKWISQIYDFIQVYCKTINARLFAWVT